MQFSFLGRWWRKNIEYNRNLFVTFVDQEKAFDRVDRNVLWHTLAMYWVNNHLIKVCRSLYVNCESVIQTNKGTSQWFKVTSGVRQGCVLSPLLFITYIDSITKKAKLQNENTNELLFADDQVIIAYEETELQRHLASMDIECKNNNMKISIDKTETMAIG